MPENDVVTACVLVIGNEILSGRTQDKNINFLAKGLNGIGVRLQEVRVIPDIRDTIINTLNECRAEFDYVITTGGIGPTHDDITSECVAQAFGVGMFRDQGVVDLLQSYMKNTPLNEARLRMAMIPEGASLIKNPVSAAPGFQMENVFVLAGIPVVMQSMLLDVEDRISGGSKISSKAIHVFEGESVFADILAEIEDHFEHLTIGSYPFYKAGSYGATFVLRSAVPQEVDQALSILKERILEQGSEIFGGEAP